MYDAIDIAELDRMADLADAAPPERFDMGAMLERNECGTRGCLLGTWAVATPVDRFCWSWSFKCFFLDHTPVGAVQGAGIRFGIGDVVSHFLFFFHDGRVENAIDLCQRDAVARLRKYLCYVRRKRALWAEHRWLMSLSRRDRRERLLSPRTTVGVA